MSRVQKAALNTLMGFGEEIVAVICGFILPRLIMSTFGSDCNGLVSSITQFLGCAVLLRSGIGGVTRAALYKPLANDDISARDSIVKATDIYMKKIGLILAIAILVFATIYPLFVSEDYDWWFSFSLFIIIGASTFAESFFGITYLILLQADQRIWVSSFLRIICYILNTTISVILIKTGFNIHIVKLGSAFIYVLYPIVLGLYVKKHYHINLNVTPNFKALAQRWDAFWQQVAVFVMNNASIIILTIFSTLLEVSVFAVYFLIINGLKRAINALTSGLEAPFGNMIAKGETNILQSNMQIMEFLLHGVCIIVYVSAALLVLQFVGIYTRGITDADYIRPVFACIIMVAQFFNGVRMPYQLITQAAGHYKQTRNGAILEPIINIGLSIVLVIKFGLIGVAIGTLVAIIFRTAQYSIYACKNIVKRKQISSLMRFVVSLIEAIIIVWIVSLLHLGNASSYFVWFIHAIIVVCVSLIVVLVGGIVFYQDDLKLCVVKIRNVVMSKLKS